MPEVYIAGAHSRGRTMGFYLKYLDPSIEILAYLYDNDEENPESINGVPVIKITEDTVLRKDCPVYLGTRGVNHQGLLSTLTKHGMENIIPVDVKLDLEIRNRFLKKYFESNNREYIKIDELDEKRDLTKHDSATCKGVVFVASSAFDKPLSENYELKEYEKIIQVGASLTDKRITADYFDNDGDNISYRNTQFCELTGLYWIWKNVAEGVAGLVHYRRHFVMPDNWLELMLSNDVDVILPVPLYVEPSIEENYKARHVFSDWDFAVQYILSNYDEKYSDVKQYFRDNSLYCPCNMFITRKDILNEMCSFLFPVLFALAENVGIREDKYQNRYPGFISERLITYFFEKNRDKYKIVYSDKNFLP